MSSADTGRASHLRGRYLLHNPLLAAYLRSTDVAVAALQRFAVRTRSEREPRRVLVAIGGHLGDAIIATSAIERLYRALPNTRFGVVAPSWSVPVFAGDARLTWTHVVDHWRVNRGASNPGAKLKRYYDTSRAALREVHAVGYDLAFDLYPYYPNMAGILWRAGIGRRVGFTSGGRSALYTDALDWADDRVHIATKHARLIAHVVAAASADEFVPATIAPTPADVAHRVDALLVERRVGTGYVVLHAGAGTRVKDWPLTQWRLLSERLAGVGRRLVFTGASVAERAFAARLARELPASVSLAGELQWPEMTHVVRKAAAVVSGDTSVAHLAAAVRTPAVVLYSGINPLSEWHPLADPAIPMQLLTHDVACAPCFRRDGCATMSCIRDVSVDDVMAAVERLVDAR